MAVLKLTMLVPNISRQTGLGSKTGSNVINMFSRVKMRGLVHLMKKIFLVRQRKKEILWYVEIKCQLDATDDFYSAVVSPQTGHITLNSTPYRQLGNQSTKYHRQQPPV